MSAEVLSLAAGRMASDFVHGLLPWDAPRPCFRHFNRLWIAAVLPPLRSFLASDRTIREILRTSRTIALVGIDPDPSAASFRVARALQSHGYRVLPIHGATNAREILGEPVFASLDELGERVDLIVVMQRDADLDRIAATAHERGTNVLWLQPGVGEPAAAYAAHRRGLLVVMNRCVAKEYEAQFPEDELL